MQDDAIFFYSVQGFVSGTAGGGCLGCGPGCGRRGGCAGFGLRTPLGSREALALPLTGR